MADIFQIENGVLKKCTDEKATSVTIPDGVKEITWMAFRRCTKLETLIIPSSVVRISKMAFINCMSLSKIVLADDFKKVPSVWFEILNLKNPNYEIVCTKDSPTYKSVKRSPKLRIHIKEIAFQVAKDKKIAEVQKSTAVSLIGTLLEKFEDSSVEILSSKKNSVIVLIKIGSNAGVFSLGGRYSRWLPKIQRVAEAFGDCSKSVSDISDVIRNQKLSLARIPEARNDKISMKADSKGTLRIFAIGILCKIRYDGLENLELSGINAIGHEAVSGCKTLKSVEIPDGVFEIGADSFNGCTSLESVVIPGSVWMVDWEAFKDCTSLKTLIMPDSVRIICYAAFMNCDINQFSHPNITIKNGVVLRDNSLQYFTSQNSTITIPDGVTRIEVGAFRDSASLESVIIPASVYEIMEFSFAYCKSLKFVTIPDSVKKIGAFAFCNCILLETIEFCGTKAQWNSIDKVDWANDSKITSVKCTDGVIPL